MMLLGIQSQRLDRDVLAFAIRARVASFRAINDAHNPELLREMRAALPDCKFGLRLVRDVDLSDPDQAAFDFLDALRPKLLEFPYDFVSGANETGYHAGNADAYSQFQVTLSNQLRFGSSDQIGRVLYGGYDFGVTWPDVALIDKYRPGLRACDMLFLHAYKLPHNSDENTIYHHRHVRAALSPELRHMPIWYSEFGLDANGNAGDGWSGPTWGWTPERYADWLKARAKELTDVEMGIIFLCGRTDPIWASWDILGHDVIADAIREVNEEGTTVAYQYLGFKGYAENHPEVGLPAGVEQYDGDGNLHQLTENGQLVGLKAFGWKVLFFAPAPPKGLPII